MIFGEVSLSEAEGAILAHSVRADGRRFRKGLSCPLTTWAALAAAASRG